MITVNISSNLRPIALSTVTNEFNTVLQYGFSFI